VEKQQPMLQAKEKVMKNEQRLPAPRTPEVMGVLPEVEPASLMEQLGFIQSVLPEAMLGFLERRQLEQMRSSSILTAPSQGSAELLFQRIAGIGREVGTQDRITDMVSALCACQAPGQTLAWFVHSDGKTAQFLAGARAQPGYPHPLIEYAERIGSALRAAHPGLRFGDIGHLREVAPTLYEFLKQSHDTVVGTVTGIPAVGNTLASSTIERLFEAAAGRRFCLIVAAESVDRADIEDRIAHCRRLKDEIHVYVSSTLAKGEQETESKSPPMSQRARVVPTAIATLASGLAAAAGLAGHPELSYVFMGLGSLLTQQEFMRAREAAEHVSKGYTHTATLNLTNSTAEACEHILEQYISRLLRARNAGWWNVAVHIVAQDASTLRTVEAVLRGLYVGGHEAHEPFRLYTYDPAWQGQARRLAAGAVIPRFELSTPGFADGKRFDRQFDLLGTCLHSEELALLMALPHRHIPGLAVRSVPRFSLTMPEPTQVSVHLGNVMDHAGRELGGVYLDQQTLAHHVLVAGMPGKGKTTTCKQILLQARTIVNDVPFLVIESVKHEYRELAGMEDLKDDLQVYSIGDASGLPLRLNPLQIVPGYSLETHIDHIKTVLLASFDQFGGLAPVVVDALREAYADRGWNIAESRNPYLLDADLLDDVAALTPTLEDVYHHVERIMQRKGYVGEIYGNMKAAIESRFGSLLQGNRGTVLNTRRSTRLEDLFTKPVVIEIEGFGDDDDKAVITGMLLVLLWEYAVVRHRGSTPGSQKILRHLTLIEEAHRLLRAVPRGLREGMSNPRGQVVEMIANMLLEMRALGEGFIIADQSPATLAPEVLAATGTKIAHCLDAMVERDAMGIAMGLDDLPERHYMDDLETGVALVRVGTAPVALVKVAEVAVEQGPSGWPLWKGVFDERILAKSAGCRACPQKCEFYSDGAPLGRLTSNAIAQGDIARERRPMLRLAPFFSSLLLGDLETACGAYHAWYIWLDGHAIVPVARSQGDETRSVGIRFCTSINLAHAWLSAALPRLTTRDGVMLPTPLCHVQTERICGALSQPLWRLASTPIAQLAPAALSEAAQTLFQGMLGMFRVSTREDLPAKLAEHFQLPPLMYDEIIQLLTAAGHSTSDVLVNVVDPVVASVAQLLSSWDTRPTGGRQNFRGPRPDALTDSTQPLPAFLLEGLGFAEPTARMIVAAVLYYVARVESAKLWGDSGMLGGDDRRSNALSRVALIGFRGRGI
jgi:DNA helicase HerA-like ATPase